MTRRRYSSIVVLICLLSLFLLISCQDSLLLMIARDIDLAGKLELSVVAGEHGSTIPTGTVYVAPLGKTSITATADSGYRFDNWEILGGEGVSIDDELSTATAVTLTTANASIRANFVIHQIGDVEFDPAPGIYYTTTTVRLSTNIADATIRYTTDGTVPTTSTGTQYNDAVGIVLSTPDVTTLLTAVAFKDGMTPSSPSAGSYTITGTVAIPTISPSDSSPSNKFTVTISTTTPGASIRYTINDPVLPTPTYGTVYSGAFVVSRTSTVKAIAYKTNWLSSAVSSRSYKIAWAKAYGHTSYLEAAHGVVQSGDSYYVVSKSSATNTRRLTRIALDGTLQWTRYYSQKALDFGTPIASTADGGIITAGGNYLEGSKYWTELVKINANGTHAWTTRLTPYKTFESQDDISFQSAIRLSDGSFAFSGRFHADMGGFVGAFLGRTYSNGSSLAAYYYTNYGGGAATPGLDIVPASGTQTGYVLAGYFDQSAGMQDAFIIVTDLDGNLSGSWKFAGSSINDDVRFYSVKSVPTGGFIVAGTSKSVSTLQTSYDTVLIRLTAAGAVSWQKYFGTVNNDEAFYAVQPTADGGFIVVGETASYGAGGKDAWIMKLASNGNITWQKTYGGSSNDSAFNVILTDDGGYAVVGTTVSFGTGTNIWVLKLDDSGDPVYTSGDLMLGLNSTTSSSVGSLAKFTLGFSKGNLSDYGSENQSNAATSEPWTTWTQYP